MSRQFSKRKNSLEQVSLANDAFRFTEEDIKREEVLIQATEIQTQRAAKMFLAALGAIGRVPKSEEVKQRKRFEDLPIESQNYWLHISKELDNV